MGFEVLLTPIAAALVIFGAVVVLDSRTVFVKSIDVPLQLWAAGYSSQTLQQEIANSMLDVERDQPGCLETAGDLPGASRTPRIGVVPDADGTETGGCGDLDPAHA